MRKIATLAFCVVALSGCATNDQLAQQDCSRAGYRAGTYEFSNCYMSALQRRQAQSDRMLAVGLGMAGQGSRPPPPIHYDSAPRFYNLNGNTYGCSSFGNTTNCQPLRR